MHRVRRVRRTLLGARDQGIVGRRSSGSAGEAAEISSGVLANKKDRVGFFSFLINVTPMCDCWNFSTAPSVADIGFLASKDPVAIDQVAADLVMKSIMMGGPEGQAPDCNDAGDFPRRPRNRLEPPALVCPGDRPRKPRIRSDPRGRLTSLQQMGSDPRLLRYCFQAWGWSFRHLSR